MTNSIIIPKPAASQDMFFEAPVASHEIDAEGVIRKVNDAECQLLGYQREELIGHHVWEFAVPEQRQTVREIIPRKIAREQALGVFTREYRRSDGTYIWLEIHERLIADAEGEIVGIHSVLIDITERRQCGEDVARSHDRMSLIFRSLPKALVTADTLGHIDSMNPAAERLTGWSQQEAMGRPIQQVCPIRYNPGDAVDLASCMLSEPVFSNRQRAFEILDKVGGCHPVAWLMFPIRNASDVIVGVVLSIEIR